MRGRKYTVYALFNLNRVCDSQFIFVFLICFLSFWPSYIVNSIIHSPIMHILQKHILKLMKGFDDIMVSREERNDLEGGEGAKI